MVNGWRYQNGLVGYYDHDIVSANDIQRLYLPTRGLRFRLPVDDVSTRVGPCFGRAS